MPDERYQTRVETNRWESFTRLTFVYFADEDYTAEQSFDTEAYRVVFTDEDRGERAEFVYTGGAPDMAQESLQQLQRMMAGTADLSKYWLEAFEQSRS